GLVHLALQLGRVSVVVGVVVGADLGGEGEAGRDGQADVGHLGEVGALAAEEFLHVRAAFRLAAAEEVDVLGGHACLPVKNPRSPGAAGRRANRRPAVRDCNIGGNLWNRSGTVKGREGRAGTGRRREVPVPSAGMVFLTPERVTLVPFSALCENTR